MRMDHVGIGNGVLIGLKDLMPGDAVFLTDLGKAVAGLDGVCVTGRCSLAATDIRIEDKVPAGHPRIDLVVFVPYLLFGAFVRDVHVDVKHAVISARKVVLPAVLVAEVEERLVFSL